MHAKVCSYISKLEMLEHPEGGWYKETYRSDGSIPRNALGTDFKGDRSYSTAIYFLLTADDFSAFHRIKSDELWHFYDGDSLLIHELTAKGECIQHKLGLNMEEGQSPQLAIPAGSWFASEVNPNGQFALVGCTVSPGFDFEDFEMAKRTELVSKFPEHEELITRLCRI